MRALIACEMSGIVRDAMRAKGVDAWSCDILPNPSPYHIQGDVAPLLGAGWDMMIAFPPCTFLSGSGLHWNDRKPGRAEKTEAALAFVDTLWNSGIPKIAIENPVGCISTRLGIPLAQTIQPYHFGEDASKRTCLFLSGLPKLRPTKFVEPRMVNGKPRWGNQTDSGQNKLGPSKDRAMLRSITYPGIAAAMADQWTS